MRRLAIATSLTIAIGCRTKSAEAPKGLDVQAVVHEVEKVRGLPEKEPVRVAVLDDAAFRARFKAMGANDGTKVVSDHERLMWIAFGLADGKRDPNAIADDVLEEQVAGFYDPRAKALFLPSAPPPSAGAASAQMILAHEVQHALQHQHFGFVDATKLPDDDARLAHLALYEGDAMVTMLAWLQRKSSEPLFAALGRVVSKLKGLPPDQLLSFSGQSPALAKAPAIMRDQLLFPYFSGMFFVIEMHRIGGFERVNAVFSRPPSTTEQVLHPQKYLIDERAVPVPYPTAPLHTKIIVSGRMGELQTGSLLSHCLPDDDARRAAEGWGGDGFTLLRRDDGKLAVIWQTEWDDEASAMRFEKALAAQPACWPKVPNDVDDAHAIARAGRSVSFVRGLDVAAQ